FPTRRSADLVDELPTRHLLPVHESDGGTVASRTPGTSDAVRVGLLVLGSFVVDDMGDVVHVEAAGGHVRGDQDVDLAVTERTQGSLTLALSQITVEGGGGETAGPTITGQPLTSTVGHAADHVHTVHVA